MAEISVQMVNSIEGHRAWVSDKTLVALSRALGIEVSGLFAPDPDTRKQEQTQMLKHWLKLVRKEIKADINAAVDAHFDRLSGMNLQD